MTKRRTKTRKTRKQLEQIKRAAQLANRLALSVRKIPDRGGCG